MNLSNVLFNERGIIYKIMKKSRVNSFGMPIDHLNQITALNDHKIYNWQNPAYFLHNLYNLSDIQSSKYQECHTRMILRVKDKLGYLTFVSRRAIIISQFTAKFEFHFRISWITIHQHGFHSFCAIIRIWPLKNKYVTNIFYISRIIYNND